MERKLVTLPEGSKYITSPDISSSEEIIRKVEDNEEPVSIRQLTEKEDIEIDNLGILTTLAYIRGWKVGVIFNEGVFFCDLGADQTVIVEADQGLTETIYDGTEATTQRVVELAGKITIPLWSQYSPDAGDTYIQFEIDLGSERFEVPVSMDPSSYLKDVTFQVYPK